MADTPTPGYLIVDIAEDGMCVGGLMVTDDNGLPLDFRFTDPITPTRLQRALYGGALERYLKADVVAGTLLGSIEARPSVIFVEDEALLTLPEAKCPVAVVDVTRIGSLGEVGTVKGENRDRVLLQAAEGVPPLRVTVGEGAEVSAVTSALVALYTHMDALEPAERVRRALGLIASGDIG